MTESQKGTVLIIEDEVGFRRVYEDLLRGDGYEVLTAEDGENGWFLARTASPDLILLDIVLPKLDGLEVLKNIRSNAVTKDIPVIVLSVLGGTEDIQEGLRKGANDYVVKAFYTPREMLERINMIFQEAIVRKDIGSFKLAVSDKEKDADKLARKIGLKSLSTCPKCGKPLELELVPYYPQVEGHRFSAQLVCTGCNKAI